MIIPLKPTKFRQTPHKNLAATIPLADSSYPFVKLLRKIVINFQIRLSLPLIQILSSRSSLFNESLPNF